MSVISIRRARYSKGNYLIRTEGDDGFKSRACRLLGDGLNCRWTGREKGYVVSPSKLERFKRLYLEGWDASFVTGELRAP